MNDYLRMLHWLIAWLSALVAITSSGCMAPITPAKPQEHVIIEPAELPSINVTVAADTFAMIRKYLGDNTLTIRDAATVELDESTKLNIPAGMTLSYSWSDEAGTFQFAKPLPTVSARKFGVTFSPTLSQILLKPDGSGVAKTGLGRYGFRWLADSVATSEDDKRPVVWLYSTKGCEPCEKLKAAFAEHQGELPFRLRETSAPEWVKTFPTLHWNDHKGSGKHVNGWSQSATVERFLEIWRKTQEKPKASAAHHLPRSLAGRAMDVPPANRGGGQ
jgi:hypothetical protein